MSLKEQLQADYMQARKDRNDAQKTILNMVLAELKKQQIDTGKELSDDDVLAIIKKERKAVTETIAFLQKGNQSSAVAEEQIKKDTLEKYMPQLMSPEETEKLIDALIDELSIQDIHKEKGKLMGVIMSKYKGQIDGALVNNIVSQK